jgi:hypothetical protein
MQPSDIDWKSGRVTYWTLEVDGTRPLTAQLDQLTEDLVQVSYPGGIVLDVGWYPDCAAQGEFAVYVVHRDDWQQPFFHERARTIAALVELVRAAVLVAEERSA